MLTMFIKAYCVNVVIYMKPTYLNKHVFFRVPLQLPRKTIIVYCEENLHWKWHSKKSGSTILKKMFFTKSEHHKPAITWSKLTIETLEQGVKYVQS